MFTRAKEHAATGPGRAAIKTIVHNALVMLLLSMMFSACASVPMASPDLDLQAKKMTPPPDKAIVYLYRNQAILGSGVTMSVSFDDQIIGNMANKTYFIGLFDPGKHEISADMTGSRSASNLSLAMKAGETYYVQLEFVFGRSLRLNVVSGEVGRNGVNDCKLALRAGGEERIPTIVKKEKAPVIAPGADSALVPAPSSAESVRSDVDDLPMAKNKTNKQAYAIVIGIEQYRQKLPAVDFATQDAKLVAEYLTKVMGYPEENVITLLNDRASNVDMVKYFEKWLPNNVEPGSTVLVYYSGHGAPNPKTSDAYLVPYDGDPAFIDETGYLLKRMYAALGKLPAKEVIVVLDTCFSGAGGRSVIAKGLRPLVMNLQSDVVLPKNMTVLAASSGDQTSSTYDEKGHGLFTYFLLKGIKNEDVTRPDGSLKLDDLFSYVKPQVERIARKQYNNEQSPQLMGHKH